MSTVMKVKMSRHAVEDRLDRLVACVEHLGVGEVVLTTERYGATQKLTSTGLCLICGENTLLITGYMCSIDQCKAMYGDSGYDKIPEKIYKTVVRNQKQYKFLLKM